MKKVSTRKLDDDFLKAINYARNEALKKTMFDKAEGMFVVCRSAVDEQDAAGLYIPKFKALFPNKQDTVSYFQSIIDNEQKEGGSLEIFYNNAETVMAALRESTTKTLVVFECIEVMTATQGVDDIPGELNG